MPLRLVHPLMCKKTYERLFTRYSSCIAPALQLPQYTFRQFRHGACHRHCRTHATAIVANVVIDSVWRHTELSFDSCFVIFDSGAQATPFIENHVAQPNTLFRADARLNIIRPKARVVRIYGAHLSSDRKKCTKTEVTLEDTLAIARKSSLRKAQKSSQTAEPSRFLSSFS